MSSVTDTILTFGLMEDDGDSEGDSYSPVIAKINDILQKHTKQPGFVLTSDLQGSSGGGKNLQINIALAAFDYLSDESLIETVRAYPWEEPDCVRLFVNRENDEHGFSVLEWREAT